MPDGKVKSIYCHWDGYPEGVGRKLLHHYKSRKQVLDLLELGDISSLGSFYDEDISKGDWHKFDEKNPEKRLKLMEKSENCTVAYKDRGEICPAKIDEDENAFIIRVTRGWEEYAYLWKRSYDGIERWHFIEAPFFNVLTELETGVDEREKKTSEQDMGNRIVEQLGLDKDGKFLQFN